MWNLANLSNFIGMIGVLMVLFAYFFSQTGKLSIDSLLFSLSNLIGAVLIIISLFFHWNLSSFIIEIAWCVISLIGLTRFYLRRKQLSKMAQQEDG